MELQSQRPMFSADPSTKGFDLSSGDKWFYPVNYPERSYQFSIVESALFHNTLVCLPTGLGKTFVAAVVMYNFWRWYPQGKIVFLAPTKPLVAQQIHACHDIMGISSDETIELTGATDQKKRQIAWAEHRVIFATPQVFHKDLEKKIVPSELVKCVVVDEAHKALGKHSYCESIRLLSEQNQYFRVLGLSATPGGKLDAVQDVVRNLHIEHLELYDDTSPEIMPYINERKLDIILVGLGAELESFKDRYITIMDRHVRVLVENNVIRGSTGNISKGRIFMIQKEYSQKPHKGHNHGQIMKVLNILMTMYHAYDLMVRHGLRAFYNFYQNHLDKFWLKDEPELMQLLEEIIYFLGPFPDVRPLPDGSVPEIPEDIRFGHNKFQKLKDLLLRHFESFENKEENTRAIVFVEYRDIVNELYVLLLQSRPLLRPQKFVGQAGQKQRQQKLALEDFRSNKVNVLISTSVGEEGLDVGEVDLIVCFDMSQVSPIRLVQRMGRTGRKRDGHIIVLVTDGKEHQTLRSAMSRRDSLNNKVLQSSGISSALHDTSPRMVPKDFNPECFKMQITVLPKSAPTRGKGKGKEAKKPARKRVDNTKKTKNLKTSEPSTSTGNQASLMKYLKRTRDEADLGDSDIVEVTTKEPRTQTTQNIRQCLKNNNAIKLHNVKLLSTDDAAVEFLTLCTMKQSANERTSPEKIKINPYLPSSHVEDERIDVFFNFEIPDLKILDCLRDIADYVAPPCENIKEELMICEDSYLQNDDYQPIYNFTQRSEVPMQDSKFEALLDDSTSDSDATMFDAQEVRNNDFPVTEKVDWGANNDDMKFEDLLDDFSNDSMENYGKNEYTEEKSEQLHSKFEDILNSSSNDSAETYYSPPKKTESVEKMSVAKNTVVISNDIGSRGSLRNSLRGGVTRESGETMVNDESVDLLNDCESEENSRLSRDATDRRHFKIITDDREASTSRAKNDCKAKNLEAEEKLRLSAREANRRTFEMDLDIQKASTSGTNNKCTAKNLEAEEKLRLSEREADRRIFEIVSGAEKALTSGTLKSSTLKIPELKKKSQSVSNEDDPRDSQIVSDAQEAFTKTRINLPCKERSQSAKDVDRYRQILLNPNEKSRDVTQGNSAQVPSNMMTISESLREIDRINWRAGTSSESRGSSIDKSQSSAISSNEPRETFNSSLSENSLRETAKVLASCRIVSEPEKNTESDEDIFGVDDLMVDSDLEEEINQIERSADADVNTSDKQATDLSKSDKQTANLNNGINQSTEVNKIDKQSTEEIKSDKQSTKVNKSHKEIRDLNTSDKEFTDLNTRDNQTSFDASIKITDIEDDECAILFIKETPKKFVPNLCKITPLRGKPKIESKSESPEQNSKEVRNYDAKNSPAASSFSSTKNPNSSHRNNTFSNDRRPSTDSFVGDINIDDFDWDNKDLSVSDAKSSRLSVSSACKKNLNTNNTVDESTKDRHSTAVGAPIDEIIIDEFDWDSDISRDCDSLPTVPSSAKKKFEESDWSKKNQIASEQNSVDSKNFRDFAWNNKTVKTTPVSLGIEENLNKTDSNNKSDRNSPLPVVKLSALEEFFEECDWSSDFEAFSCKKEANSLESPGGNSTSSNSAKNSLPSVKKSRVEDPRGWISTEKPKLRLTLGRKLTNNIINEKSTKQTKKLTSAKQDSDSENEFAVARVETTAVKEVASDYFAKPADPVDKATRQSSLGMYNPRKTTRGPLSLRRNDDNRLNIEGLRDFSAPAKYTQQQKIREGDTKNTRSGGATRQKSASVDLDTRRKKKSSETNRQRLRVRSEFIDDEAEVSSDEKNTSGSSGVDEDLENFVSYTQHIDDSVDMQAHYLQTVRSPRRPGGFMIRKPKSPSPDLQIYSQALPNEPNDYLYDSFCVAEDDDDDVFEDSENLGEITMLEELRAKSRKRKRGYSTEVRAKSKRKIIARTADLSSSDDELENLRRQVRDESFALRNQCD